MERNLPAKRQTIIGTSYQVMDIDAIDEVATWPFGFAGKFRSISPGRKLMSVYPACCGIRYKTDNWFQ
jgi:hypothetical protein